MDDHTENIIKKYMENIENNILYSPLQKQLFRFDERETVWMQSDLLDLTYLIRHILTERITWTKEEHKIVIKYNSLHRIIKICYRTCLTRNDDIVISQFNQTKGVLPIRNNKSIDLKTLQIRPRVYSDYFTCYCNINYNPVYNKERIYRVFASIFCQSYNDTSRQPTTEEIDMIHSSIKMLGYAFTGENHVDLQAYEENEKNDSILVSEQRERRKALLEKYKVYVWNERYSVLFFYLSMTLDELCNCDMDNYSEKKIKQELKESNYRIISLPNTCNLSKIGTIQACVPLLKQTNEFGTFSYNKVTLPIYYHKNSRDDYPEVFEDFFSACCEGAYAYYQEIERNGVHVNSVVDASSNSV